MCVQQQASGSGCVGLLVSGTLDRVALAGGAGRAGATWLLQCTPAPFAGCERRPPCGPCGRGPKPWLPLISPGAAPPPQWRRGGHRPLCALAPATPARPLCWRAPPASLQLPERRGRSWPTGAAERPAWSKGRVLWCKQVVQKAPCHYLHIRAGSPCLQYLQHLRHSRQQVG
jgi:hypothetical protein